MALAVLFSLPSGAQQTAPPSPDASTQSGSSSQSGTPAPPSDKSKGADEKKNADNSGTSKDRLFFALPNFLTVQNAGKIPPLTAKQKFGVVTRSTFDPAQFPWFGLLSAINQADNSEPAYGQGWAAYGKRYGTTAADSTIENFMVGAVLPSMLRQDPRYFQSGQGSFIHRAGYAVSRIVVTRSDSGHHQFNFSEVLGSALSAAISTYSYHPKSTFISTPTNPHLFIPSDRTLTNTAKVWTTQLGVDTMTLAIKEFWPDVQRKLAKKRKGDAAGAASSKP